MQGCTVAIGLRCFQVPSGGNAGFHRRYFTYVLQAPHIVVHESWYQLMYTGTFFHIRCVLLSSSARKRLYPQRSYGQAMVTGVYLSLPRCVPSFVLRIGFSIPTFQLFVLMDLIDFYY